MPTTVFKSQVEQFLRRVGQGNVVITLANPTLISNFSPEPTKFTLDQIHDYFYFSGISLFNVLERITKNELNKTLPGFYKRTAELTLTSGSYTITEKIRRIIDPVTIKVASVNKPGYLIPDNIIELCISSAGIRTISVDYPGYYLRNNKINCLPDTATKVTFNYIMEVPRLLLSSVADDIWPDNYSDLLIDGAVMLAKGDSNEIGLEQFYFQKLQANFAVKSQPITNQNNTQIETA